VTLFFFKKPFGVVASLSIKFSEGSLKQSFSSYCTIMIYSIPVAPFRKEAASHIG